MGAATGTELTTDQLQQLANDPAMTLANLGAVMSSLSSDDTEVTNWACEALENCGPPATESLLWLERLVEHPRQLVASWACRLIARMGHAARSAQPHLVSVLVSSPQMLVREEAARALGLLGTLDESTRTALQEAAQSGGPRLKRLATAALTQ